MIPYLTEEVMKLSNGSIYILCATVFSRLSQVIKGLSFDVACVNYRFISAEWPLQPFETQPAPFN
jgi:hypothetical protein